jgi:DNA invertase Pin-like site-specific DNA recombinase
MLVAGYRRVSTDEQAEYGFSLDAQATQIREYAARRGWQVANIYTDAGLSGTLDQRPALNQLLADAAAGQFQVVVVHAIDRLYRNLEALLRTLTRFQQQRVSFVSLSEEMDFTTPWGKLTLAVLGTLAEIYIDKLSAETRKGKLQRAKSGLWNGSIPLGYCNGLCAACTDPNGPGYCPHAGGPNRSDGQVLIAHPIESQAIKLAFDWYASGNFTNGQIAEKLNAARYTGPDAPSLPFRTKRSPSRGGPGPFSKDSVRDILARVFYTGVVPYYGVNATGQKRKRKRSEAVALYPGQHPALIDQATFDEAEQVRQLFGRNPRKREQTPARIYPLTGMLRCGHCRAKMRGQTGSNGRAYYLCPTRTQRTGNCPQPGIPAKKLEAQLHQALLAIELPENWQDNLLREQGIDPSEVARQRAELEARLARAKDLYLAGDLEQAAYEAERHSFKFKLANLQTAQIGDIITANKKLRQLQTEFGTLTNFKKKKLLQALFAAVYAQGLDLRSAQPTQLAFPLLKQASLFEEICFYNGSDGCDLFWREFVNTNS